MKQKKIFNKFILGNICLSLIVFVCLFAFKNIFDLFELKVLDTKYILKNILNNELNVNDSIINVNIDDYSRQKSGKISQWPKCIDSSTLKLEPHRIPVYLYELSSEFHSYWNMGKEDSSKRFIEKDNTIKYEKIIFLKIVSNVIKNGMHIIGVETPEQM